MKIAKKAEINYNKQNSDNYWVRIKPCAPKYENNTFLGILLGDLPLNISATHKKEDNSLKIFSSFYNPAIFVFELNKIIFGSESYWWQITDKDELDRLNFFLD